jgi:peptidoglycan/LPS O-acetylase OafA/YrhL
MDLPPAGRIGFAAVPTGIHRPGLDGLRAWAVIAVVAFHAGALSSGWVGVDIFMALSGFLITRVIVGELESTGRLRLRTFWLRRARRLVPGLLLLLVIVTVITAWAPAGWPVPTRRETIGALTYTSNWVRIAGSENYWALFAAPSALDHLWSLAVEEQFYVVWPLVVACAWRIGGRRALQRIAVVGAIALGAWQVALSLTSASVERIYVGTDTRAPSFLLGAAMCVFLVRRMWCADRARVALAVSTMGLVAACLWLDGQSVGTYGGPLLVVGVLGAVAAGAAAQLDGTKRCDRLFTARPIRAIGRWSYGIYLFHWPLLVLLRDASWPAPLRFVIVGGAATLVAAVSYECYERPIRDGRLTLRWAPVAAVVAAATVVGAVVVAGVPRREIDAASEARLRAPLPSPTSGATESTMADVTTTRVVPPGERPTGEASKALRDETSSFVDRSSRILVVGDSVAFGLTEQLVAAGKMSGNDVAVRAAPGCTMSTVAADQNNLFSRDLCVFIRANLRRDVTTFEPDRIVLLFGGTWSPLRAGGTNLDPCTGGGREALLEQGRGLLDDLSGTLGDIYVVVPPRMSGDYVSAGADAASCYADAYTSLAAERSDRVTVLRLDREVCAIEESTCARFVRGVELRYDGLHYTRPGGELIARWLIDQLDTQGHQNRRSTIVAK